MFMIVHQNTKLELQTATVKACYHKEENLARIAVFCIQINVIASADFMRPEKKNKKTFIGKISLIIFFVAGHYLCLPKAKISQIYNNYYKPENFYRFCHLESHEDKNKDKNITFEYG